MDTIFKNSKDSKTFDLHRLILNLSYKINLKSSNKMLPYQTLVPTKHGKIFKKSYNKLKTSAPTWNNIDIWMTWWVLFCIKYSTLFGVYHQKTWNTDW